MTDNTRRIEVEGNVNGVDSVPHFLSMARVKSGIPLTEDERRQLLKLIMRVRTALIHLEAVRPKTTEQECIPDSADCTCTVDGRRE